MTVPTIYSEWVTLLDKFGNGNDETLEELKKGSFTVDAGTAHRFYSRVEEAYKKRKQYWLDTFQRSLQLENFRTEADFEIALRNGKQNLSPLHKFVGINGLPEDLRKTLKKDFEDFVAEIQESLKKNVSKVSSGKDGILILLNTFKLNEPNEESNTDNKDTTNDTIKPTGRKIIF